MTLAELVAREGYTLIIDSRAFYPVSHEIAEDRCGFTGHHQLLWREQLNILARWCARLQEGS